MTEARAPAEISAEVQDEDKVWLALAYFGPLAILPLKSRSVARYVKFHARQGLGLFVIFLVFVALSFMPLIGFVFWILGAFVYLATTALALSYAFKGRLWRVPIAARLIDVFSKEPKGPAQE